jgi:hypothetical protein
MTWLAYQRTMKDLLLGADPAGADLSALGGHATRWQAYRRMVRSRFYQTLDHGFERLVRAIGTERFHRLVDRFLAEDPPKSPYLRDLPGELLRFAERRHELLEETPALPAYALDLMRYEWAELDTAYSPEAQPDPDVVPLEMDRPAVLSPAHRLLRLEYTVHAIGSGEGGVVPVRSPVALCLYRDPKTYEVETLVLTPVAATLLFAIANPADKRAPPPLVQLIRQAAALHGSTVDAPFVEALSTLLADLSERGLLLGSLASQERPR